MQTYNVSNTYRNLFGTKSSGIRSEFYGDEFPLSCGIIGPAKSGKTSLLGGLCFDQSAPYHLKFQSVLTVMCSNTLQRTVNRIPIQ